MYPTAEITNGVVRARFYLPDPRCGYYRGTRFDWAGVLASLQYAGHDYFGEWFERHEPTKHDAIVGPVEEFVPQAGGLGYDEAQTGDTFVRIGVGSVRKPEEAAYRKFGTYEIVDPGAWVSRVQKDWIEFRHELAGPFGYAYEYRKVLRLEQEMPQLTIEHTLINKGQRSIDTEQYNHNFFVIDGARTGPDFLVRFPFELNALGDLKGLAETSGACLVFLQDFEKGQSIISDLQGYGRTEDANQFSVENLKTGAGVCVIGDRPLSRLVFWSMRNTICPEPYVQLSVAPGSECSWRWTYRFYTLAESNLVDDGQRFAFHQK